MRRTWMLLLVTVLLTVFLAVPAMAADCEDCSGANHCCDCVTGTTDAERHPASEGWKSLNAVLDQYLVDKGLDDFTRSSGYVYTRDNAGLLEDGGKYYLEKDLDERFMFNINITICLNGHTWSGSKTADGSSANCRAFGVNTADKTVNIVDCSVQDENGVSAGEIQGGSAGTGGAIYASGGAVVNIYNGTITGGTATGTGGGNVYLTGASTAFNMHGGVIEAGSTSKPGGNVYISAATFTLHNGTIRGGTTTGSNGGNVYMTDGSTLELNGGTIENGEVTNTTSYFGGNIYVTGTNTQLKLIKGHVTGGKCGYRAGNIYLSGTSVLTMGVENEEETPELNESVTITGGVSKFGGNIGTDSTGVTINMYYGTISGGGGSSTTNAGNIWLRGSMNMYGGVIKDGSAGGLNAASANFHIVAGKLIMSGGHIYGRVNVNTDPTGTSAIQISGKAKIYDEDKDGDGLCDYGISAKSNPVILGKLDENARIAIQVASATTLTYGEGSYEGVANDWDGYIQNRQIVGHGSKWLTWQAGDADGDGEIAAGEGIATYEAEDNTNKTRWHCVCGANPFEGHIGDCDTYDYGWDRITDNSKLATSGKYYLDMSDVTPEDVDAAGDSVYSFDWASIGGLSASVEVYLDMNGHTVEQATDAGRFLTFLSSSRAVPHDIVITDSSQGHTARLGTYGAFAVNRNKASTENPQGKLFWMSASSVPARSEEEKYGDHLSIYRITLDASSLKDYVGTTKAKWRGAIANVGYNSRADFYNCDMNMVGSSTLSDSVGAMIRVEHQNAVVNIKGGTMKAGSAYAGAAIALTKAGHVNIDGTTIYGGAATVSSGGALYASAGTMDIRNALLIGGTSKTTGGVIHAKNATLTISNSVITNKDGTDKTVPMSSGSSGGAIYAENSDVDIIETTIEGATATTNGGLIAQVGGTLDLLGSTLRNGLVTVTSDIQGGGAIYADGATVTIDKYVNAEGGTSRTNISDSESKRYGGAICAIGATTIHFRNGTISNCTATSRAGNVYLDGQSVLNMGLETVAVVDEINASVVISGGKLSGTDVHGGNLYVTGTATINLYYGTIKEGKAGNQGGNLRMDGTLNMYGGIIKDGYTKNKVVNGEYKPYGNNNANMMMVGAAEFNMSGGHIHGYVASLASSAAVPAISLSGDARIYSGNSGDWGLRLDYSETYTENEGRQPVTITGLTENARIVFGHVGAKDGLLLTAAPITDDCVLTGLSYYNNSYKLQLREDGNLYLASAANATGAVVNDGDLLMTLPQAVAMASDNDFVRLLSDYEGTITVDHSVNLDLNGKKITPDEGKSAIELTAGTLQLVDSANYAYTDEGNCVTIDNQGGTIERAFITGTFTNYGANHRYLVLKHQDNTYSAHRIYLAVQTPVLYPVRAAMSFKTVLGCDQTVANYINNGGQYGVIAAGPAGSDAANYLAVENVQVLPYSEKNEKSTAVVNILDGSDDANRAVENLSAQAYMVLNDYFYKGEAENKPTTSAEKKANLKQLVQATNGLTSLSNVQKVAVAKMYNQHLDLMGGWGLDKIAGYAELIGDIERHCLCGDTASKNNPCAAKGHLQLDWQLLPAGYTGGALADGNYYLKGDLTLTSSIDVAEGSMVCLDTHGYTITSPSSLADVSGVFNLTNSQKGTKESVLSMSANADSNGGLLIQNTGNVSLYKGVTLQAAQDHTIGCGVVQANGSLNVYGGTILGATLKDNDGDTDKCGGAVYVGANGYLFINSGTIQGANNNKCGGAIYTSGGHTYIKGEAQITAPDGSRTESGGLIYMAGGEVNISGVSLDASKLIADYGTAITVASGTLNLSGKVNEEGQTRIYDTVITGGTAEKAGAALRVFGENATVNVNGAKIIGGTANGYWETTTDDEGEETTKYITGKGGAVFVEQKGELYLTNKAMLDGGTADLGGNLCVANKETVVTLTDSFVSNGQALRDYVNHSNGRGSNMAIYGGTLTLENTVVSGGTVSSGGVDGDGNAITFDNDSETTDTLYGGSALYASGGETVIDNSKLYGNLTAKMWKHGSTIFNLGGTISITNTEVTASWVETDSSVLYNRSGTFTMTNSTLDASTLSQTGDQSITYAGAVRNNGTLNMEGEQSQIIGYAVSNSNGGGSVNNSGTFNMEAGKISGGSGSGGALGGNVRSSGTFNMEGGSIEGGTITGSSSRGGNVAVTGGEFNLSGGTITGGISSTYGGNIYQSGGNFNMTGGTISSTELLPSTDENYLYDAGKHAATAGGNVYVAGGTFKMSAGTVTGGVSRDGGNIYITTAGTAVLSGGTVENGRVVSSGTTSAGAKRYDQGHGGNIYNGGHLTISDGTITGGKATHTSGNVYSKGHLTISGGTITGGQQHNGTEFVSDTATNLMIFTGNLTMTGGTVEGGITINNYSDDYETSDVVYLKVGGKAKLLGTNGYGVSLTHGTATKVVKDENGNDITTTVESPIFDAAELATLVTSGEDKAQICIQSMKDSEQLVVLGSMTEEQLPTYRDIAENVFVSTDDTRVITFEEDGIYLREPATDTKYGCACGANEGEDHVNDCVGYDVLWTKWSGSNLPNVPGYWYLDYENEVVDLNTTYLNRDFLKTENGGLVCGEGSNVPLGLASVVDANGDPTGEMKQFNGKSWVAYEKQTGETVLASYDVHLDLNGHKIDGANGGRVYSYLNTINAAGAKRQAAANLTIIDSSEGHTGGMSTAGGYGGNDSFTTSSQAQGSIIWMPQENDSLTTCFVELNASTATHGWGHVLDTEGKVDFYESRLIGGTATSYIGSDGKLKTSTMGGGALTVNSNADVTLHGGSITGGKAIYEWVRADYGERKTSAYGGANVYVDGGIFTMDGGAITGGETWIVNGTAVNDLIEYTPGVGGGVYMHNGEFHVKGDAKVYGNYYYSYTVNDNGTEDDLTDDTYDCEKIDSNKKSSNVYLGSGAIYNDGLTSGAQIGIHKDVYEGVIAHTTSDCSAFLYRDDTDAQVTGAIFDGENGTLALGVAAYRVGYGMASIQPTDEDLATGLSLNGYGNTAVRTTDKLYNLNGSFMDNLENSTKLNALKDFEAHSDLAATAVAITDAQGETVLLISVDMTSMGSDTANKAKNMIAMKTGVPKENIVISAGHQHSCPSASTIYYKNAEGQYTDANGTVLTADQDRVVKTDFARTFYHGVLNAAVKAVGDRKEATVTAGILDTANDDNANGYQFNFVRNKTITVKQEYTYVRHKLNPEYDSKTNNTVDKYIPILDENGEPVTITYGKDNKIETYNITDNHYGVDKLLFEQIAAACGNKAVESFVDAEELRNCFDIKYESEIDTTMQLVKFSQTGGKEIVLANFQTHPHKAGGSANYHVHSDVIGAFRYYLKQDSGAEVIYFSGASGNVNTTGALDYQELSTDYDSFSFSLTQDFDAYKKLAKAAHYGDELAALASAFISADGNMTEVAGARDVSVASSTVTYTVQAPNLSDGAIARINANILHWDGGEDDGTYLDGYDPTSFQANLWWEMVGQFGYDQPTEKVYSAYHASRAYMRYKAIELDKKPQGEISISAYNIGGIGFVQAPYEMFQESGQAIKGNVPGSTYVPESGATNKFAYTIIATQANAGHGYIAARIGYQNGGGYSSTDNSLFAEGTAETLVNEYVSMLNGLYK